MHISNMLFGILAALFVALVARQVTLHVQTGGKLFFQNHNKEHCITLPDGRIDCNVVLGTATMKHLVAETNKDEAESSKSDADVNVKPLSPKASASSQDPKMTEAPKDEAAETSENSKMGKSQNDRESADTKDSQESEAHTDRDADAAETTTDNNQAVKAEPTTTIEPQQDHIQAILSSIEFKKDTKQEAARGYANPRELLDATHEGNVELVQAILKEQPEWIDLVDHNRWTPLHIAARAGHTELVKIFLDADANLHVTTATKQTALEIAERRLPHDHAVISLLKGQVLADGTTFSTHDFRLAAERGDLDQVQHYLEVMRERGKIDAAAFIDEPDANLWNALHMAARAGRTEMVQFLVEQGADVARKTGFQKTALTIAIEKHGSDHAIVNILRDAASDEL
jgi:hypothetical protein